MAGNHITKLTAVVAYANDFKLTMIVALIAPPLILKRPKAQPDETAILE